MNESESEGRTAKAYPEQSRRVNPFTTGLVFGLGWGLVFGLVDGLPILLEVPILEHLRMRLQALVYLTVWYQLIGMALFGVLGLITWGIFQLVRREPGRGVLIAVYTGLASGLLTLLLATYRLGVSLFQFADLDQIIITLAVAGLAVVVGLVVGLSLHGGLGWWLAGANPHFRLRWKPLQMGLVAVFVVSVIGLSVVAFYRAFVCDLPMLNPKLTDQVATPEHPNVLLISIDALRADHTSMYGYDPAVSPHMNALASRGVVFDQAITQAPWTAPSVASFITSLHPTELGIVRQHKSAADMHVDKMRTTLAEVLHDAGYRTQAYVTNSLLSTDHRFHQGFDDFLVTRHQYQFDLILLRGRTLVKWICGGSDKSSLARQTCKLFDKGYDQLFDAQLGWGRGALVSEDGINFMRMHKDERFFLWLYYIDPHARYDPPEPFHPLPEEITPGREKTLRNVVKKLHFASETLSPVDLEALVSLYDGEIMYVDALIGQVLDELDRLGLTDRTVIVLNADHGEEFYDHGDFTHGHALYDELVRVPLIISGPGVEAVGRRVDTQVRMLDMMPTVCELAGVPIPEEAQGRSLVPFLQGQDMEELPAFSEALLRTIYERKSIRYNGYKLIHDVERGDVELYDLRADPLEKVNLAEEEPELVETMLAELNNWMVRSARLATEMPRLRSLREAVDEEMERRLQEAGY
jgi:arylsulfatase A-like enzyme